MRVLLVSSDNNKSSGAFICLVELAKMLQVSYRTYVLVILPKPGDGAELLEKYNIPYIYIYSFSWVTYRGWSLKSIGKYIFKVFALIYNYNAIKKIKDIIVREKIDIVHINTIFSYVGAIAAFETNTKLVWHIRESLKKGFNSKIISESWGYDLINRSNQIIMVSHMLFDEYEDKLNGDKVSIIHDGVSLDFYQDHTILDNKIVKIISIGSLISDKNQIELIEALNILVRKGICNFCCSIVGRGPTEKYLKYKVKEYHLENYIRFLGYQNNIKKLLSENDVVCSTSISEAFGRTLVEGMLSACIVIGADYISSAAQEIIIPNETGILYKGGMPSDLANCLKNILNYNNRLYYRLIGEKAQKIALQAYTDNINVERIFNVYKMLI